MDAIPPEQSGPGTGTAAAASFAGVGLVAAGWAVVLVLGLVALWALAPDREPPAGTHASVNAMAKTQRGLFDKCKRPKTRGDMVVRYVVEQGRVTSRVAIDRSNISNAEVERCVTSTAAAMKFTPRDEAVTVVMPVEFR